MSTYCHGCHSLTVALDEATAALTAARQEIEDIKSEWASCCERERARWEAEKVLCAEIERYQVQLAACGVAALGGTTPDQVAARDAYGWSPAYQDVLDLRLKYDKAERELARVQPVIEAVRLQAVAWPAAEREFDSRAAFDETGEDFDWWMDATGNTEDAIRVLDAKETKT